jgi:hypothetical protein
VYNSTRQQRGAATMEIGTGPRICKAHMQIQLNELRNNVVVGCTSVIVFNLDGYLLDLIKVYSLIKYN